MHICKWNGKQNAYLQLKWKTKCIFSAEMENKIHICSWNGKQNAYLQLNWKTKYIIPNLQLKLKIKSIFSYTEKENKSKFASKMDERTKWKIYFLKWKCFIFAAEIENYLLKMKRCNVTKRILTKGFKNLTTVMLPPKGSAKAEKASDTPFKKKICLDIKILLIKIIDY